MDLGDALAVFARAVILPIGTLLPLINPPGTVPIFLSMTTGRSAAARSLLARRIAWHSFALLAATMSIGSYCLMLFGLSLASIKIAGGLLVMTTAWHLLRSDHTPDAELAASATTRPAGPSAHDAFHPLTFPITIGPGSLSVAVTLGATVRADQGADAARLIGIVVGIFVVCAAIYVCYRFASPLLNAFGHTGSVVLIRLSAFVLLSVGVQILCDGVGERFGLSLVPPR